MRCAQTDLLPKFPQGHGNAHPSDRQVVHERIWTGVLRRQVSHLKAAVVRGDPPPSSASGGYMLAVKGKEGRRPVPAHLLQNLQASLAGTPAVRFFTLLQSLPARFGVLFLLVSGRCFPGRSSVFGCPRHRETNPWHGWLPPPQIIHHPSRWLASQAATKCPFPSAYATASFWQVI